MLSFSGGAPFSKSNGEGGYSYITSRHYNVTLFSGHHIGPGEVFIIPSFKGCGCEHICLMFEPGNVDGKFLCQCNRGFSLTENGRNCTGKWLLIPTATTMYELMVNFRKKK